MTARYQFLTFVVQRDVVPIGKMRPDFGGTDRIVRLKVFKRFIGQNDAPAKSVIGLVALEQHHLGFGSSKFCRDSKAKTRWSAAEARNAHMVALQSRSFAFWLGRQKILVRAKVFYTSIEMEAMP